MTTRWGAVGLCLLVLGLSGCSTDRSSGPRVSLDQAHGQLDSLFEATSSAVSPGAEWGRGNYLFSPDYTGLCGTQGCRKTGKGELSAKRWVKGRVSTTKQPTVLDQVFAAWTGRGLFVQRDGQRLKAETSQQQLEFSVTPGGCAELNIGLLNVEDTTAGDEDPFRQSPDSDNGASCATVDDPYWSR